MRLVMTLLVRDEADIVDAHLTFHLNAGVDYVVATDNRSEDGTTEILQAYARDGRLHLITEPGNDYRQGEWVTRMARMAATEFGADWVINSDADEFWWPNGGDLKEMLGAVPKRYGVVRGFWRVFVPRPDDGSSFAERMLVRLSPYAPQSTYDGPLHPQVKNAHRGDPTVEIRPGLHDVESDRLVLLRGWYPFDVLHFPVRSAKQYERKLVYRIEGLGRNPDTSPSEQAARAYNTYRDHGVEELYDGLVADDSAVERGLAEGTMAVDARLRDALRLLAAPGGQTGPGRYVLPGSGAPQLEFPHLTAQDELVRAVDANALPDAVDQFERRLEALERRVAGRPRAPLAFRVRARVARALGRTA